MGINSTLLARSITSAGSKQSFYTAYLLVDRELTDDCHRAYAYFRWLDDMIDAPSSGGDSFNSIDLINRQKSLVDDLYNNEQVDNLSDEEQIIADLIKNDKGEQSKLQSFIRNFLSILEFDAHRRGHFISQEELTWYSSCLGKSVTDAIQYFIKSGQPYPQKENQYLAANAAHITHMLRDMAEDIPQGYINIPDEYLKTHEIAPNDFNHPEFQNWVRDRVKLAREYFQLGRCYLDELTVLRCKIAGYWYCARFEAVLDTIERDNFLLREEYAAHHKITTWLKMAWITIYISVKHFIHQTSSV
jgi:phytoene/squalene synthetase